MPLNDERLLGEFADTQREVHGKQFAGARINDRGDLALSWRTLWWGPLWADSVLTSPGDCRDQLPHLLEANRARWRGRRVPRYADSASSAGVYWEAIAHEGATARATQWPYTVSYNKWTGPLEKKAQELPALAWKSVAGEQFGFLRPQSEGASSQSCLPVCGAKTTCCGVTGLWRATRARATRGGCLSVRR